MSVNNYNDPNHVFSLDSLLTMKAPAAPKDFQAFWYANYRTIENFSPNVELRDTHEVVNNWRVIDVYYSSTNNVTIGGWLLIPVDCAPKRAFIVGHGYAGRNAPDFDLPFFDAAIFFPCSRGLSRSARFPISQEPQWHVLHDIDNVDEYIMKGCVEDTWLAVSCMELLFPYLKGHLGYLGNSFTGGIGVLAMAQEHRISRAHFSVPTFGHHRLRLRNATVGSGHAVQNFFRKSPKLALNTLRYYDAANAAEAIKIPLHFALALKDPVVTPPGQFAIYNAVNSEKQLFVLDEGHSHYAGQEEQERKLTSELIDFFSDL